jgi:hypothetical protein
LTMERTDRVIGRAGRGVSRAATTWRAIWHRIASR